MSLTIKEASQLQRGDRVAFETSSGDTFEVEIKSIYTDAEKPNRIRIGYQRRLKATLFFTESDLCRLTKVS